MRKIPRFFDWLVVAALLLTMAVIVSPRFSNAADISLRSGLQQQLSQLQAQIDTYAHEHSGNYPKLGADTNKGWNELIRGKYISNAPLNLHVNKAQVFVSLTTPELLTENHGVQQTDVGWFYNPETGRIIANGYDHINNAFHDEKAYAIKDFAW